MPLLPLETCYCDCVFCLEVDEEHHGKKHRKEETVHKGIAVYVTRDSYVMGEVSVAKH